MKQVNKSNMTSCAMEIRVTVIFNILSRASESGVPDGEFPLRGCTSDMNGNEE